MDRIDYRRTLPLLAAQSFFLWMFFATSVFEFNAPDPAVHRFAARWRHGMTDRWLLYVPGFIASAAAAWMWGPGRNTRDLIQGSLTTIATAVPLALIATPFGAELVASDYAREIGPVSHLPERLPGAISVLLGVYTLIAWTGLVLSLEAALIRWSWRPLLLPVALDAILIAVRPFTFGDLISFWAERTLSADPVALFSLGASVAIGVALWLAVR